MRIIIITTLNDNLFHAKLMPLLLSRDDLEIVVVTDREGPNYERVKWVWPRGIWARLGRLGGRLPLLLGEIFHPQTRLVMAYNIVPHGLFAVVLAKLRRVPVYLHFIGGEAEINFADNVLVSDNRLINRTRNPHRLEKFVRRVAFCADKIFVPGHNTEDYLLANGFHPEIVVKLHSTIDPERFFPSDQERDIDVIVAAQIRERKQPLFVLEIFREILNLRPETKFCWLGDGALHDEFAATLDRLQLRDSVTWRETNEVAEYYRRSKVFLLCSLREGLSLASMEAMRCGMPVIASDCGDMSDTVLTGETGQLMPKNATKDQYVDAVMGYLNNPAELERQSKNAFDIINKEHTFPVATDIWKEILDTLA